MIIDEALTAIERENERLKRTLPPIAEIERRIGKNVICLQRRVLVIIECVGKNIAQVRIQATDGKVHVRHLPRIRVCLLTVDTNLAQVSLVALDKLGALYKHTTASAARVIDSALVRLQNLYQRADNAGRRIELATILALQGSKLLQTVFVGSAQPVSYTHLMVTRKLRELMPDTDIKKISDTFHAFQQGTLEDEKGFCAVCTTEQIAAQDFILTPGRYVGIAEDEGDGVPFEEKMTNLTGELKQLFEESKKQEEEIRLQLKKIGWEV